MQTDASRAKSIFLNAAEIPSPAEREAYIAGQCGENDALRREVLALLQHHAPAAEFLESPAVCGAATVAPAEHERSGVTIGPYKLIEQIGEGGMGAVWTAQQIEPVKRVVALKLIKPGLDSHQVIARFEAERQALALMDHPNIAKVLDAGTTESGRPYFVMELVKGMPITRYCDERHLTPRQRLELFVPVCQAIQHAHQKGIIHRDIKPSNVLVTLYDDKPVPKVIDFGVAKATGQQLTEQTLNTGFGAVVGTLEYMSPEQAGFNQLDIDTRSDIYSLGVLLYELLAGSPPFTRNDLAEAGLLEMLRVIREQEPSKPSTKLSSSDALPSLSANRGTEPAKLTRLVRGELDWIVMKALEKDRARRYETANGFAADLQRYLDDEPVQACPPSAAYRFRKFAMRNRAGLLTASLLGVALLLATSAIGWAIRDRSAQQAETERQRVAQKLEAERERAAARQQLEQERLVRQAKLEERISQALDETQVGYQRDRLLDALTALKRAEALLASDNGVSVELRKRVEQWRAELTILERLEELAFRFTRDQARETDNAYSKVFVDMGINIDVMPVEAAGQRIRSHLTWERLTEALDRWAGLRHEIAMMEKSQDSLSNKQRIMQVARATDTDDYRSQVRLASEKFDIKAAEHLSESPEVSQLPASTLSHLAMVIYWGGGKAGREKAVRMLESARAKRPGEFRLNTSCANYYMAMEPPRWAEAAHYWAIAVALRPEHAGVHVRLADSYDRQGKVDEAAAAYHRAIELDAKMAWARVGLGNVLLKQGKPNEAVTQCRKAIEIDPISVAAHYELGYILAAQGKLDEAVASYRKAIELDPKLAAAHSNLGIILADQGKLDGAIDCFRKALELNPKFADAHSNLGAVLNRQGKLDEAIACFRKAIDADPKNAIPHLNLGTALQAQGKLNDAIDCFRKAIELDPNRMQSHDNLGLALLQLRKLDEAVTVYRSLIKLHPDSAPAYGWASKLLWQQGTFDEALATCAKLIELQPQNAGAHNELAWYLATCPQESLRDPPRAVELATRAIQLAPRAKGFRNTLAVAHYRAGHWKQAIDELSRSVEELGENAADAFFLAMAHWQLDKKIEARKWFDKSLAWMEKNGKENEELKRFRTEAAKLLGIMPEP